MPAPSVILNIQTLGSKISNVVFSDVNFQTKAISDNELSYNLQAIGRSVITILSTYQQQRLFHPTFGSNLEVFLFDPVDEINAFNIKNEIVNALTTWERRIVVSSSSVSVVPEFDEERYSVTIKYSVPELERESSVSFNLARGAQA